MEICHCLLIAFSREGFECDLVSRGANVELPWTYRGASLSAIG